MEDIIESFEDEKFPTFFKVSLLAHVNDKGVFIVLIYNLLVSIKIIYAKTKKSKYFLNE